MPKVVSVPTCWTLYEVSDDVISFMANGMIASPPHAVIEVLVMGGHAKRLGTVSSDAEEIEEASTEEGGEDSNKWEWSAQ